MIPAARLEAYYSASYPPDVIHPPDESGPHITAVRPNPLDFGAVPLNTVYVDGSGFDATSVIEVDGAAQDTNRYGSDSLAIVDPWLTEGTFEVTVRNADDSESNSVTWVVVDGTTEEEPAAEEEPPPDEEQELPL